MSAAPASPATASTGVAESAVQRALEWQVTFWSGEVTPRERAAFDRWLAQDADHARAWNQVQRTGQRVQSLTGPVEGEALRAADAARRTSTARNAPPVQSMLAEHRTRRGERRDLLLPDGTRLVLDTDSAIDLRFTAQARDVLLRAGEVFIATAPDPRSAEGRPSRPFSVHTRHGAVQAIGTRFAVRLSDERSMVSVDEGAVRVQPRLASAVRLEAGQRAWFSETAVEPPTASIPGDPAWTRGLLVAERMRLRDFLAELGRYRSGVLRCDPAVQDLIVSGVYPLDDTDLALSTLAHALPVRIDSVTRYWVTVRGQAG
ncbi:MAG: histidine kinase [Bordetella sp. SCN 68-11]|nr:MAG: histidine kinase [Bordetella sp. SCN 68-11]